MSRLANRVWSVDINDRRISSEGEGQFFAVEFGIKKSVQREPNTATLRISGLSPATRQRFEQLSTPTITIRAGYEDLSDTLFVGDATDVWSDRDGTEYWLNVEASDGGTSYRSARINRSFEPGVSVVTVILACADSMGVGMGNTQQVAQDASLDGGGYQYVNGYTLDGVAWRELDQVCRSVSLRWSVQNGALQLRAQGQPAETSAIRLTPSTGLVGTPARGRGDRQAQRTVSARALMIPGLYPGRVVVLDEASVTGNFLCREVQYTGKTRANDWYADLGLEDY